MGRALSREDGVERVWFGNPGYSVRMLFRR
jgi:hypothetical protein